MRTKQTIMKLSSERIIPNKQRTNSSVLDARRNASKAIKVIILILLAAVLGPLSLRYPIIVLAAQVPYTLSYDANGGTGAPSSESCYRGNDDSCRIWISLTMPTRTGYTFLGWGDSADSDTVSESINIDCYGMTEEEACIKLFSNKTLYAIWEEDSSGGLSYQSEQDISFTFAPAISLSVSGDLTIESLTPGDYKDSNIITVTATSNAVAGYSVSGTVGSSTYTSTELRKGGTDTTNKFTHLTTNKANLSAFDDNVNTWGYSYSVDFGSTWQSGDITGTPQTGYNGLPLYTTESPIKLINSNTNGTSSIQFKIGARSTATQLAGEYKNVVNFIGVANLDPEPSFCDSHLCMQEATLADCGQTMYDDRGDDAYKEIGYSTATINSLCWMTRNLDLPAGTTITSSDSNIAASSFTLPADSTSFDSNTTPQVHNTNSTNCGDNSPCYSYYNYPAATAGTNPSSGAASSDICPSGWRLPTSAELTALKNTYTIGATLTAAPFLGVYAGNYYYGDFYAGGLYGHYWSPTADSSYEAYYLIFNSSSANVDYGIDNKCSGVSVRCVMKNS